MDACQSGIARPGHGPWRRPRDSPRKRQKRGCPCVPKRMEQRRGLDQANASFAKKDAACWCTAVGAAWACVGDGAASEPGTSERVAVFVVASGDVRALQRNPPAGTGLLPLAPLLASCYRSRRRPDDGHSLVPVPHPPGRMPDESQVAGPEPGARSRAIERMKSRRRGRGHDPAKSGGCSELLSRDKASSHVLAHARHYRT
jgi:hypothetical protein